MDISFEKTIRAISLALDLAEISSSENLSLGDSISSINLSNHEFYNHSKRTTYIALKLGKFLKLDETSMKLLYISSLLHDIGATNSLNKSHTSSEFIKEHCAYGAKITHDLPIFNNISSIIHYHHENCIGTGPFHLTNDEIPIESKIIHLSDIVELMYRKNIPAYKQRENIIIAVKNNSGTIFDKKIVDAFLNVSSKEIFGSIWKIYLFWILYLIIYLLILTTNLL